MFNYILRSMRRRQYLALTGGTLALAGCGGSKEAEGGADTGGDTTSDETTQTDTPTDADTETEANTDTETETETETETDTETPTPESQADVTIGEHGTDAYVAAVVQNEGTAPSGEVVLTVD